MRVRVSTVYCKDCEHCEKPYHVLSPCYYPAAFEGVDVVTGEPEQTPCYKMREFRLFNRSKCGPKGKLFKQVVPHQ